MNQQADSSSSSAESKTAPTVVVSNPSPQHSYKCRHCSRKFKTIHALRIHQSSHRGERKTKPNGAVSDEEDGEVNGPAADEPDEAQSQQVAPERGSGSSQNPAEVVTVAQLGQTQMSAKGKEPAVAVTKPKALPPHQIKPKGITINVTAGSSQPSRGPLMKRAPEKEMEAKDFLGEWNPMSTIEGFAPPVRVLDRRVDDDDLDLELKLDSMNKEHVDLELKL